MKNIISINYEIPGHSEKCHSFRSSQSLLDADIVLINPPGTHNYETSYGGYKGKPLLDEHSSMAFLEDSSHWKNELKTVLAGRGTVFVFFPQFQNFFVHTGDKTFSGTGRNRQTTKLVDNSNNYKFFPIKLPAIVPKSGKKVKFHGQEAFVSFWNSYKDEISFEAYLDGEVSDTVFSTITGKKVVGAVFAYEQGFLVLLPKIHYNEDDFTMKDGENWNKKGVDFGNKLIKHLVDIDKSLRSEAGFSLTPPPKWSEQTLFSLKKSDAILKKLALLENQTERIEKNKQKLKDDLAETEILKGLLFEKGKALENSVIAGLTYLGYSAENFDEGNLELDQVIVAPEKHRFIGETEGKDNTSINITKFRQLATNIQEDLQRDEVLEPAIGILFGNAFRLEEISERGDFFTDKCLKSVSAYGYILVRTTDLFFVAKYLCENRDVAFAKKCRKAISSAKGSIVQFPEVPAKSK